MRVIREGMMDYEEVGEEADVVFGLLERVLA